ncbi:MAG: J domain-containing protein [Pseudomonadota bacterium]
MFDRSRTDNARQFKTTVVEMTLNDGRALSGKLLYHSNGSLFDALNGSESFLDFEPFDGQREFVAKSTLRTVRLVQAPPIPKLPNANKDNFDPHSVLRVPRGADAEALRAAYLEQSKKYHPDRYANADLPDEIRDYLQIMARRVNTAYETLQNSQPAVQPVHSEPVWQSR